MAIKGGLIIIKNQYHLAMMGSASKFKRVGNR